MRIRTEAWTFLLAIIALIIVPLITGFILVKIYRNFYPLPDVKAEDRSAFVDPPKDSFAKMFFVGLVIWIPIYAYYSYIHFM